MEKTELKTETTSPGSAAQSINGSFADIKSEDVRKALRRVDFFILLPLVFMFVFLQFDRTNLGNALTDTFRKDAHVTQDDINLGQTLFTLGIVLWEIPSNIIIKRVGAHRWLPLVSWQCPSLEG